MLSRIFKQSALFLLIVSLVIPSGLLFYPRKTQAAGTTCLAQIASALGTSKITSALLRPVPTADNTTQIATGGSFVVNCVLTPLAIQLARAMLQNITAGVVNWINNGFSTKDGGPIFTQDLRSLLRDSADDVIGGFIANDLGAGFLCNSFSLQLKISLAQTYMPYRQRSACSLTQISNNVSGFAANNNSGGWDQWLQVTTVPQNNVYGATVLAQDELSKKIFDAQTIKTKYLDWGSGFRSWRVCTVTRDDGNEDGIPDPSTLSADDERCASSETRTPGSVVESQLTASLGSDMRRLEVAKDIDAIVGALTNQLMAQVIGGAQGLLGAGTKSSGTKTTATTYQNALNAATADRDLDNAVNAGLTYSTNESNLLFTQGQEVAVDEASTTDSTTPEDQNAPAPVPEIPRIDWIPVSNSSPLTSESPLIYELSLSSNYSTSSLRVTMSLRKGTQPVRFLDIFFNPQITVGRSDGSQAVGYISSVSDVSQTWTRVSASKNANFNFKLLGYKKDTATAGTYVLETSVYDAQSRLIKTVSADFVVQ